MTEQSPAGQPGDRECPAQDTCVCPFCGDVRILAREYIDHLWEGPDREPKVLFFLCDNADCDEGYEGGFDAFVAAPNLERTAP